MIQSVGAKFLERNGFPIIPFHESWFADRRSIARMLRESWESICRETKTAQQVEELHAARDDIRTVLDRCLSLLKDYGALLELTERMTNSNGPLAELRERINHEAAELSRLSHEIFSRWETVDDIAEMLIDKLPPLTPERLKYLAERHPPRNPGTKKTSTRSPLTPRSEPWPICDKDASTGLNSPTHKDETQKSGPPLC